MELKGRQISHNKRTESLKHFDSSRDIFNSPISKLSSNLVIDVQVTPRSSPAVRMMQNNRIFDSRQTALSDILKINNAPQKKCALKILRPMTCGKSSKNNRVESNFKHERGTSPILWLGQKFDSPISSILRPHTQQKQKKANPVSKFCITPNERKTETLKESLKNELEPYLDTSNFTLSPYNATSDRMNSLIKERFMNALKYMQQQNYKNAILLLKPAVEHNPLSVRLSCNYAICLHLEGIKQKSDTGYRVISKLALIYPDNIRVLYNKAIFEVQLSLFSECLQTAEKIQINKEVNSAEFPKKSTNFINDVLRIQLIANYKLGKYRTAQKFYAQLTGKTLCENYYSSRRSISYLKKSDLFTEDSPTKMYSIKNEDFSSLSKIKLSKRPQSNTPGCHSPVKNSNSPIKNPNSPVKRFVNRRRSAENYPESSKNISPIKENKLINEQKIDENSKDFLSFQLTKDYCGEKTILRLTNSTTNLPEVWYVATEKTSPLLKISLKLNMDQSEILRNERRFLSAHSANYEKLANVLENTKLFLYINKESRINLLKSAHFIKYDQNDFINAGIFINY